MKKYRVVMVEERRQTVTVWAMSEKDARDKGYAEMTRSGFEADDGRRYDDTCEEVKL